MISKKQDYRILASMAVAMMLLGATSALAASANPGNANNNPGQQGNNGNNDNKGNEGNSGNNNPGGVTEVRSVPDGGSSILLLGAALMALAGASALTKRQPVAS